MTDVCCVAGNPRSPCVGVTGHTVYSRLLWCIYIFYWSGASVPFTVGAHVLALSCGGGPPPLGIIRLVRGFLMSRARKFPKA